MPLDVIAAVLLAALVHAGWNALAKSWGAADPLMATSAIAVLGAVLALPLLLVAGLPAAASIPYVVASGAIHVVYFVLVGLAYRGADYSAVYPLTRGSAPLVTALLSSVVIGEVLPPLAWLGIAVLGAGIIGLGSDAQIKGGLDARSAALAGLNIVVIVTYTLVDGAGVRVSGNPAGYVLAMMALTGLMLLPVLLAGMGRGVLAGMAAHWRVGLVGGAMVTLSYGTALWAMTKAPIAMVAALRETSVLFAAMIGALLLRERLGPIKASAAALILIGLVLLRLS
jgi:drug/metabolite transporter (DMT)-like permease